MSMKNQKYTSASSITKQFNLSAVNAVVKTEDTSEAEAEIAVKDETRVAEQTAALTEAKVEAVAMNNVVNTITKQSRSERIVDTVERNLEVYRTATNGSSTKIEALVKVLDAAETQPKKNLLDTILKFFIANKDESFLDPLNALQGITLLNKSTSMKLRLFYEVMRSLSLGTATRNTISLEVIRSVFAKKASDDFTNWVSQRIKLLERSSKK
jgi:hypothetical protein